MTGEHPNLEQIGASRRKLCDEARSRSLSPVDAELLSGHPADLRTGGPSETKTQDGINLLERQRAIAHQGFEPLAAVLPPERVTEWSPDQPAQRSTVQFKSAVLGDMLRERASMQAIGEFLRITFEAQGWLDVTVTHTRTDGQGSPSGWGQVIWSVDGLLNAAPPGGVYELAEGGDDGGLPEA